MSLCWASFLKVASRCSSSRTYSCFLARLFRWFSRTRARRSAFFIETVRHQHSGLSGGILADWQSLRSWAGNAPSGYSLRPSHANSGRNTRLVAGISSTLRRRPLESNRGVNIPMSPEFQTLFRGGLVCHVFLFVSALCVWCLFGGDESTSHLHTC